jgi:hypothetical protein
LQTHRLCPHGSNDLREEYRPFFFKCARHS